MRFSPSTSPFKQGGLEEILDLAKSLDQPTKCERLRFLAKSLDKAPFSDIVNALRESGVV